MSVRNAQASWEGTLKEGNGTMTMKNAGYEGPYTFSSRFEEGKGTNPEELIGAALAGCFSMALAADLERAGHDPKSVETKADVHLEKTDAGPTITRIVLTTQASVPGIDQSTLEQIAEGTRQNCPVSRALTGPEKVVNATLID